MAMSRDSSAHNLRSRQVPAASETQLGSLEDARDEQWRKKAGSKRSRSASAGKSTDRNPLKSIKSLAHSMSKQDLTSSNDEESRPASRLSVHGPTYATLATNEEQPSSHDDGVKQQHLFDEPQRHRTVEHLDDDALSTEGSGAADDDHSGATDRDRGYVVRDQDDDNMGAYGGRAATTNDTPTTGRRDDSGPTAAAAHPDTDRPAASQPPLPRDHVVSPTARSDWDTTMAKISSPHGELRHSDAYYLGDSRATFESVQHLPRPTTSLLTMDYVIGGGQTP